LHRDDLAVREPDDRCDLRWPLVATRLPRLRDHDHDVITRVEELDRSASEAFVVAVTNRPHHVGPILAVPLPRLEREPLHIRIEDRLDRVEVALLPGRESPSGDLERLATHPPTPESFEHRMALAVVSRDPDVEEERWPSVRKASGSSVAASACGSASSVP